VNFVCKILTELSKRSTLDTRSARSHDYNLVCLIHFVIYFILYLVVIDIFVTGYFISIFP